MTVTVVMMRMLSGGIKNGILRNHTKQLVHARRLKEAVKVTDSYFKTI